MPQFFVSTADIIDDRCTIRGDDARHLVTVRRAAVGQAVVVRDEAGRRFRGRIAGVTAAGVTVAGLVPEPAGGPSVDLTLCLCLLKGGEFDDALQRAVEIGAARIVPVRSARTVPMPRDPASRAQRWNRIAREAAKQAGRERVPDVDDIVAFDELVAAPAPGLSIIAHTGGGGDLRALAAAAGRPLTVRVLVGPEGGFADDEVARAAAAGWRVVTCGATQLRAGTAALVLPALIIYEWGYDDEDQG